MGVSSGGHATGTGEDRRHGQGRLAGSLHSGVVGRGRCLQQGFAVEHDFVYW